MLRTLCAHQELDSLKTEQNGTNISMLEECSKERVGVENGMDFCTENYFGLPSAYSTFHFIYMEHNRTSRNIQADRHNTLLKRRK